MSKPKRNAEITQLRARLDSLRWITEQISNVIYNCKRGADADWMRGRAALVELQNDFDAWRSRFAASKERAR